MHRSQLAVRIAVLSLGSAFALRAQTLERTVDATIKPGDDFFAYANGAWLAATTIPPILADLRRGRW